MHVIACLCSFNIDHVIYTNVEIKKIIEIFFGRLMKNILKHAISQNEKFKIN